MTGLEHYREAERLVASAHRALDGATENTYDEVLAASVPILAQAQVHATLALAAATAQAPMMQRGDRVHTAWHEAVAR